MVIPLILLRLSRIVAKEKAHTFQGLKLATSQGHTLFNLVIERVNEIPFEISRFMAFVALCL